MRKSSPWIGVLAAGAVGLTTLAHGADRTSEAIDRGVAFLLPATEQRLQQVEGEFSNGPVRPTQQNGVGRLAFQVYALVVAGVSVEHPTIQRSFQVLERMALTHTYSVALYAFALDAAISQMEDDFLMLQPPRVRARFRGDPSIGRPYWPRLQQSVEHFVRTQNRVGAWRYGPGAQDFDNSNVQFAVLALGVGAKRNIPIDSSVWVKVMDHFVKGQQDEGPEIKDRLTLRPPEERGIKQDDVKISKVGGRRTTGSSDREGRQGPGRTGVITAPKSEDPEIGTESIQVFQRGWDYADKGGATWNMSCAGLSSLLLARESLRGVITPEQKQALDKAIWDGYGWVMGHWQPNSNYYGMYSLEKVGDIGEVVKFGSHDWYEEMSNHLLGTQVANGSWPKGQWADDEAIATSYALLILNRATSLLAMDRTNKIVVSGRRGSEEQDDRNWVYIRKLDTSMHAPSLFRAVRLRPSAKLVQFLEEIVENYPETYRGELVPELVSVRDAIDNKNVKKVIDGYLRAITGSEYDDADTYMKWARRWKRVLEIGESRDPSHNKVLLQYFEATSKSVPLKKMIMWALVRCKVKEAIPLFLDAMEDDDADIRAEAYNRFKDFFIDFPPSFDPKAPTAKREGQIAAIKAWYLKQIQ